ncbi:TVP38/TMEM64 family protein [Halopenitus sp. POP-27]|uniref:TVP38/TMEM64 family protein n=1 Tax=Halopenitus sp. POP-27 TaxID=2994425 RepID=UPI00246883BF|nr:TVP38/TMEM64 family protein [Halopenitus sp. POP-27]
MQIFSSRADRWRGLVGLALLLVAFGALYLLLRRYAPFVFDAAELRVWIAQFGVFAPLVFVLIQATQVVVAPIPGQIVALVSGYLFGSVLGTVYSLTGVLIGSAIAFSLAKRFGRSFVEDILHEDVIERFDGFVERVGIPGLLVFVLIPGLPDDAICFLSGLTTLRLRTFIAIISVGRLPAYVLTVYAGGEFADGQIGTGLLLIGIIITASVVGYFKQDAIRELLQRAEPRLPF